MAKAALALAVIALARGAYGGMIREPGDRFTIAAEGDLGAWMIPDGWEPRPKEKPESEATATNPAIVALEAEVDDLKHQLARGAYGGMIREPGDRFTIAAEGDLGAWMIPDGWEPRPKEKPESEATATNPAIVALEAEVDDLKHQLALGVKDYAEEKARADTLDKRVAEMEKETTHDKAVFDDIRVSLVKVVGLPANLKLAEAVAWMADRLSAPATTSGAAEKAKPKGDTKKE